MNRFLDQHKDNWHRLEDLLAMLQGTSLRGLSKMEVREFGELYRRAASDLAIARAETRDTKLIIPAEIPDETSRRIQETTRSSPSPVLRLVKTIGFPCRLAVASCSITARSAPT